MTTMKDDYYVEGLGGRKVDYLTLEQKIMAAWQTVDDIKTLYNVRDTLNEDQIDNALIGLEIFASMRFDELWQCFEQVLHNKRIEDQCETPAL